MSYKGRGINPAPPPRVDPDEWSASEDKPGDERRYPHDTARVPETDYEPIIVEFIHTGDDDLGWVPHITPSAYVMDDTLRDDLMELFFEATALLDAQRRPVKKGSQTSEDPEERENK